jgi:hypothetical protein
MSPANSATASMDDKMVTDKAQRTAARIAALNAAEAAYMKEPAWLALVDKAKAAVGARARADAILRMYEARPSYAICGQALGLSRQRIEVILHPVLPKEQRHLSSLNLERRTNLEPKATPLFLRGMREAQVAAKLHVDESDIRTMIRAARRRILTYLGRNIRPANRTYLSVIHEGLRKELLNQEMWEVSLIIAVDTGRPRRYGRSRRRANRAASQGLGVTARGDHADGASTDS